jgi:endonuclease/exonuclease/phosphatase family metal-dependent hydrolase
MFVNYLEKIFSVAALALSLQSHAVFNERTFDPAEVNPQILNKEEIRIGTWNLKRLGNGSKRYDLVARVINSNMDVVSLQEVMNPDGLQQLLKYLPGWEAVLSSKVGRNGYFEYYAVLARRDLVAFTSNSVVKDDLDVWAREPLLTCMKTLSTRFCMVTIHVIYGDSVKARDEEIKNLSLLLERLSPTHKSGLILVGDFNRELSSKVFNLFPEKGFYVAGNEKTTLGENSYSNSYDHIILNLDKARWSTAKKVDISEVVCLKNFNWCSTNVSDHAPVVISIKNK